ncbi:amidohydrolase family protein [Pseudonocardia sp. TRM90224]|uniref:amidohydrolase family protein n=1 Tax=Pseudonocardia sp. TRM90224 TaxID=2812678 RepID=UPI001E2878C7|nr:amidohydrolase family protein [Pseudonocardia sp. TRM90224]
MPRKVIDAHRLAGPVPFDDLPTDPRPEMERLGIDSALVTHTIGLYSDPQAGNDALAQLTDPRLIPVPVVVPGVAGADVHAAGARLVRLCPQRHRFDLTGPIALRTLGDLGVPVAVDFEETSPAELRTLAGHLTELRMLVLNPGYRHLRALAELLAVAPNVWTEIGTVNTEGGVEWLAERFGAQRLVFGTGAPVLDDCGPRFLLDHLDLPPADVDLIAAGSLEGLLEGLPG